MPVRAVPARKIRGIDTAANGKKSAGIKIGSDNGHGKDVSRHAAAQSVPRSAVPARDSVDGERGTVRLRRGDEASANKDIRAAASDGINLVVDSAAECEPLVSIPARDPVGVDERIVGLARLEETAADIQIGSAGGERIHGVSGALPHRVPPVPIEASNRGGNNSARRGERAARKHICPQHREGADRVVVSSGRQFPFRSRWCSSSCRSTLSKPLTKIIT